MLSLSFVSSPALLLRAPPPRMVATAPAPTTGKLDLVEPVFPEQCEYCGVTLSRYARANPDKPDLVELVSVMTSVERGCKTISNLVRRSPMSGLTGLEDGGGSVNELRAAPPHTSGCEEQKKLDVITNTVLKNALKFSGATGRKMGVLASEEEDAPVGLDDDAEELYEWNKEVVVEEGQKYVAVFDPLDGSSNVDANIPTGAPSPPSRRRRGTIFGIFEEPEGCTVMGDNDEAAEAGYCLYSAATELVMSFGGKTCQGFTLDEQVGEFILTKPNMQIPKRGKPIYSANRWDWEAPLRDYITAIQKGEGETGKQYTARYLGSMVGDIHRTLLYGGIFGYPGDAKNPNGELRGTRILDIEPTNVHQRVPCFFGSADDVAEMRSYYK
ncbi:FBPase [Emiliania huxleyi CCMP1516]|uniref:fructose-bisphosphatase n=2 Tax=Emiliania huxleyi TaxID=2903 RepID=A0A0D3KDK0_EMIH1|nr:FBPase [Emiliania huxleyi CCMP1516]EOD33835.1 FBPase [Emiliania huxleyi CCMP1516]|eukprot:XP_005786264.1 FBPase [Emiliania huxleyi CCMP1516]